MVLKLNESTLILFDLDGTLVDSHEAIYDSAISVLSIYSQHLPSREEVFKSVGLPIKNLFMKYLNESLLEIAVPEFRKHLQVYGADKTKLLSNAFLTLEKLKSEGISIALVSNKQTALARSVLEQQKIDEFFELVVGSDQGAPKPAPDMINLALSKFPKKALSIMVGDRVEDMAAAKSAGIQGVFLENSWNPTSDMDTLIPFKPRIIKNLDGLFQAVLEIKGEANVR